MTNGQIRDLCIALLHAETEDEVIGLLKTAGYWDQPALWRHYGDVENNWGQGGNQQSLADTARDDGEADDGEANARKKLGGLTRYRKREGVLFVRNGQTQGALPKDFFRRDSIKLKTLADD